MKRIIITTVMIMAVTLCTNLFAQKPAVVVSNEPGWTHIGHTTASFKMQDESVIVLGADEFTALKIKVSEANLHLERMQVFYESGETQEIDLRDHFKEGTESRSIRLEHPDRDINKVAFTYKTENATGEKADIDLYGLKTNQPAGADSYKDEKHEVKQEAREAEREIKEESRELRDEVKEESREAREEARETEREIDADIEVENDEDLADRIEEGAKDATAAITDRKLKNKVGPGNETAYVDQNGKYYYINNAGEKVSITKLQLKDKPQD
jgi:hypothetical protein